MDIRDSASAAALAGFAAGALLIGMAWMTSPEPVTRVEVTTVQPSYAEDDPQWTCSAEDNRPCVNGTPIVRLDDTPHDRCMAALRAVLLDISLCEPLLTAGDQP